MKSNSFYTDTCVRIIVNSKYGRNPIDLAIHSYVFHIGLILNSGFGPVAEI